MIEGVGAGGKTLVGGGTGGGRLEEARGRRVRGRGGVIEDVTDMRCEEGTGGGDTTWDEEALA